MRKFFVVSFLLSSPLIALNPANSADLTTEASITTPPIVVSASRIEQPINQVGSSIVILSGEELRERGVQFVSDALLEVPSLTVTSQGARGSQTQIRIRGNEANHVLVLIDGVRVSNASTGEFDFANLSMDTVERIEVLLGPQSTLYGSDSAAGVISITTRKGSKGFSGKIHNSVGSLDTNEVSALVNGGNDNWHYTITANRYETAGISSSAEKNGNSESDAYERRSYDTKIGYDSKEIKTWIAVSNNQARFEFDRYDDTIGEAVDDTEAQQWIDTHTTTWVSDFPTLNGRLENHVQFAHTEYDYESYSYFFGSYSTYTAGTDRDTASYQGSYHLNNNHTLQFGTEQITEKLNAPSLFLVDNEMRVSGTYLQWLASIGDTNFSVGARQDNHSEFGTHNTGRMTISHPIHDQWRLRASVGTGFKAPTLFDLFAPVAWGGNPDLEPETSSSTELGLEYKTKHYHSGVTLFKQDTDNLIRSVNGKYENVDKAKSDGIELSVGKNIGQLELNASITWMDSSETIDGKTGDRLRMPEWSGNLLANYFYNRSRIWAQGLFRDKVRDQQYLAWPNPAKDVTLDAYWLIHMGMSYDINEDAILTLRVENVANRQYEEVFSYGTRGRTGSVSVDWRF